MEYIGFGGVSLEKDPSEYWLGVFPNKRTVSLFLASREEESDNEIYEEEESDEESEEQSEEENEEDEIEED